MNFKKAVFFTLAACSGFSLFAAAPADDRAYIGEFSNIKFPIVMLEDGGKKQTDMNVDGIAEVGGVLNLKLSYEGGAAGAIMIPLNSVNLKFKYKQTDAVNQMFNAFNSGKYAEVVNIGRRVVYPAVPLMFLSEDQTNVHFLLSMFLDSLIRTERFAEAKSLMESLQLSKANATIGKAAIDYARNTIAAGRYDEAANVLARLNFGGDNVENIPYLMSLVDSLRKFGKVKEAARWYTKLQNTPDNPRKDESTLWMAYSDMQQGNVISAQIFLDQYKALERTSEIFSLRAMIEGMLLMQKEKLSDALDQFAQGIVFGDVSSDWSAELYYNAGMAYKKLGRLQPANEIFGQVILLYPESQFAAKAKAEIVEIKADSEENESA